MIGRLRKQSSCATFPSMSMKLATRDGSRSASSSAVSPPIECPTRWNRAMICGDIRKEAAQTSMDTFRYTNAAPQAAK